MSSVKPEAIRQNVISFPIRLGRWLCPMVLFLSDYTAILLALCGANLIRTHILPIFVDFPYPFVLSPKHVFVTIPFIYLVIMIYEQLYVKKLTFWQGAGLLFKVDVFASALMVGFLYFTHDARVLSRIFILLSFFMVFIALLVSRFLAKRFLVACRLWQRPVVIIGTNATATKLAGIYQNEPAMGYEVVAFIEEEPGGAGGRLMGVPVLPYKSIESTVLATGVKDVVIAAPHIDRKVLMDWGFRIQPMVKNLIMVPDMAGLPMNNLEVETNFQEKMVCLKIRNNLANWGNRFFKRFFDIVVCLAGFAFLAPVFGILCLLIYLDSPGPVIFSHKRVGTKGRQFSCFKFRTMVIDSQNALERHLQECASAREEWERDFKLKNDPRVTRIGKFLRKTSLDELPQLINVIRGDMSLVGPRPIVSEEVPKYGQYISDYYLVHPGITGYWQTNGRNDVDYDARVRMDSWYVRNWSVWLDMVILVRTIGVVFKRDGAY